MGNRQFNRLFALGAAMTLGMTGDSYSLEVTAGREGSLSNTPMMMRLSAFEAAVQAAMNELNDRIAYCSAGQMLYAPSSTTPPPDVRGCIPITAGGAATDEVCSAKGGFKMTGNAAADSDGCVALQLRTTTENIVFTNKRVVMDVGGKYSRTYTINFSNLAQTDKTASVAVSVDLRNDVSSTTWPWPDSLNRSIVYNIPNLSTSLGATQPIYLCVDQCDYAASRWTRTLFASYDATTKVASFSARCENNCANAVKPFSLSTPLVRVTYSKLTPVSLSSSGLAQ